jgi:low temperature requirement protein LtrA
MYDVRFTADSLLERCCKAIHLGVMVGFAEIGTAFEPDAQIKSVFRTLSFFLMFSRLVLAVQYGVVAWQIRKYTHGKNPMILTAAVNLAAAAVYCGISFRYDTGKNSRVYVVWYILGIVEMAAHLIFSQLTEVLTFRGTHLGERMTLLTLIVLGEGMYLIEPAGTALSLTVNRRHHPREKCDSRGEGYVYKRPQPVHME